MKLFLLFFVLSLSFAPAKSQTHNISLVGGLILSYDANGFANFTNLSCFFEEIQKNNSDNTDLEIQVFSDLIVNDIIIWHRNIVFYSSPERRNSLNFTGMGVIKSSEEISFLIIFN